MAAAWAPKVVVIDDLEADSRWPKYRADALTHTPIRSVLSLPMFADELSMVARRRAPSDRGRNRAVMSWDGRRAPN